MLASDESKYKPEEDYDKIDEDIKASQSLSKEKSERHDRY